MNDLTYKAQGESEPSDKKQFTQMLDFYDLMKTTLTSALEKRSQGKFLGNDSGAVHRRLSGSGALWR